MTHENNIRKSFALLALAALLTACSSSAVETTPTADAQPTLAASLTEVRVTPTQPVATATAAPTSPAATTPAAHLAILDIFPLSVGATWIYSVTVDDVVEYHWMGPVTETITAGKPQGLGWIFQSDVQGYPFRTQPAERSQSYVVLDERVYKVPGNRDPMEYVATEGQSFGFSQILTWPLKVGQRWGPSDFLARGDMYVWRVEAQESVSAPAGRFDGCYRLSFYWADSHQLAWFCAGVGFVRWETHHHGSRHDEVWKLQESRKAASRVALSLVVEEYPIVASSVYTPDRLEYTGYITRTILERRQAWRNLPPIKVVEPTNQVLAKFGFRLEPNPIKSNYEYQLYQGNILIQDQVRGFRPPTVNQRGEDFCLWAQTAQGDRVICRQDNIPWPPGPHSYAPPIFFGDELLMAHYEDGRVLVQQAGKTIYSMPATFMVADPIKGLWAWDGHWVLEVEGQVAIDGKSLNKELGYDEIFNWRLLKGQPFYFFKKGNHIGVSYAGRVSPYSYDEVIHYRCCEPAMFNVGCNENMVWFHALKDGMWYYVEIGTYG